MTSSLCTHANLQPDTEPVEDQEVEREEEEKEEETEAAALGLQSVGEIEGLHVHQPCSFLQLVQSYTHIYTIFNTYNYINVCIQAYIPVIDTRRLTYSAPLTHRYVHTHIDP